MQIIKNKALLTLLTLSLLCSSCATYRASPLPSADQAFVEESINTPGVSIASRALSKKECLTYLDRNVLRKGYQPLELTFYNNTVETYFFSPDGVSLPTYSTATVARKFHSSIGLRVGLYAGGAFILFGALLTTPYFIPLVAPAAVDGICSIKSNEKLSRDFREKAKAHLILPPKTAKTTLIFVPKNKAEKEFEISLVEKKTRKPMVVEVKE